ADRLLPEMALLVFVDDVEAAVHEDAAPVEQVLDLADLECDRPPAVLVLGQDLVLPPVGRATVEPALRVDVADWLHIHVAANRIGQPTDAVAGEDCVDLVPAQLTKRRRSSGLCHPLLPFTSAEGCSSVPESSSLRPNTGECKREHACVVGLPLHAVELRRSEER